jgi:hypothetical protein
VLRDVADWVSLFCQVQVLGLFQGFGFTEDYFASKLVKHGLSNHMQRLHADLLHLPTITPFSGITRAQA